MSKCPALKQLPNTSKFLLSVSFSSFYSVVIFLHLGIYFHSLNFTYELTNYTNYYQTYTTASEMVSLRELDLRAAKKQVCKITPELVAALKERFCKVRGGVVKKAKGGGKKKAPVA